MPQTLTQHNNINIKCSNKYTHVDNETINYTSEEKISISFNNNEQYVLIIVVNTGSHWWD